MNRDQFQGGARHLKGRAQTALGGIAGDPGRQIRGAANQVAGGAQYAYGTARDRAEDLARDGRHIARDMRDRADTLIEDGRGVARDARDRAQAQGRRAVRYADANRTSTLLGVVAAAFALGWLARPSR